MQTAKAQISMHICAVWSGLHCPLTESLDTTVYINDEKKSGWYFAHAQDDLNLRIFRMLEGTFSLCVAQ